MKTPLTYYGGKQMLCRRIVELIPQHTTYAEAFAGGAAVFFQKQPSAVEVLNDKNGEVMNFYLIIKERFEALQKKIVASLHSRELYRKASVIYHNADMFSSVDRAWAFWILCQQGYAGRFEGGTWGFDKSGGVTRKRLENARALFTEYYLKRLESVQLENADALYIIDSRDYKDAFFYLDPPYIDTNCGPYRDYTKEDFIALLEKLSQIRGKFLLSSGNNVYLNEYTARCGWQQIKFRKKVSVLSRTGRLKEKAEILTANYPIKSNELW